VLLKHPKHADWANSKGALPYVALGVAAGERQLHHAARALLDSGSQWVIIGEHFARGSGLTPVRLEQGGPRMQVASGEIVRVQEVYPDLTLTLAAGTDQEVVVTVEAVAMPGLEGLTDVILSSGVMHEWGSAGVDSVLGRFKYRPRWASHGDMEVHSVPVLWRGAGASPPLAAMLRNMPEEDAQEGLTIPQQQQQEETQALDQQQQQEEAGGAEVCWPAAAGSCSGSSGLSGPLPAPPDAPTGAPGAQQQQQEGAPGAQQRRTRRPRARHVLLRLLIMLLMLLVVVAMPTQQQRGLPAVGGSFRPPQ
jgi:hypothetical protein